MIGRREFGLAGISAAALAAMPRVATAQQSAHAGHGGMYAICAKACSDCQRECDACAHHCAMLLAEGKKEHLTTLQTCQDCADLCATACADRRPTGAFAVLACRACADACNRCGKECEKLSTDKMMAQCAEVCRACEKSCREMTEHAG